MFWEIAGITDGMVAVILAFMDFGIFNIPKWILIIILVVEALACMYED